MKNNKKEIAPVEATYYTDYFVKKTRELFRGGSRDWHYEIGLIVENAKKYKGRGKVLELGCGVGPVLFTLSGKDFDCFGVDFDGVQIKSAKMLSKEFRIENIKFMKAHPDDILFKKESFDIVVSNNLVEHIPDNELFEYFKTVHLLLKKDGIFIIQTKPAKYTYLTKQSYVWLLIPFFIFGESIFNKWLGILDRIIPRIYKKITGKKMLNTWQGSPPGHCNCHEYKDLLTKIEDNKFKVLFGQTFSYPWSRYYRTLKKILPFDNVNTNIFIVARKSNHHE